MNPAPEPEERHSTRSVNLRISQVHAESGARQFVGINTTYNINKGNALDLLPYADPAPYNSRANEREPSCLPDTRENVLQEIYGWADRVDGRCVFWLNGWAGTGKSTIARTVACKYDHGKRLGASFFFSRGDGDVCHAGKFFTSIAVQLAEKLPSVRSHICEAITTHSKIASQRLSDQWHQLILQPLSKLDSNFYSSSLLLVIDALDECDDDWEVEEVVKLLAEARSLKTVSLRVFLTSRPEIPIRLGFQSTQDDSHEDFILHNVSATSINNDISIFLAYNFKMISQQYRLDSQWPGDQVITSLVQKANGLFIWAATACRFIDEGREFAAKRLAIVLENDFFRENPSRNLTPEKQLNQIYLAILENSVHNYQGQEREERYSFQKVILGAIVLLLSPLPFSSLTKLLQYRGEDIEQTLDNLHSILSIPKDRAQPIRLHHPSFRDFLLSNQRCGSNFWVDDKQEHVILAQKCLQIMSATLKRDGCGLHTPGILTSDIDQSRVKSYLQPEIRYACVYWVQHVLKSDNLLHDGGPVHDFLKKHFLHWLEAMALIERTTEGVEAIVALESLVKRQVMALFPVKHYRFTPPVMGTYNEKTKFESETVRNAELYAFIYDAKRFALFNQSFIRGAPLQIYCSALLFAPEKSDIKRRFKDEMPTWIDKLSPMEDHWSPLEQTLEGHFGPVTSVAFYDGKIVSGSEDKTVRVWDAASGWQLQRLEGHSSGVRSVAFSPGGGKIVSGSDDKTIRVWDVASWGLLKKLEGHSDWVRSAIFSPDGRKIVSGSDDGTVRVWDVASGEQVRKLEGHSDWVRSVAFSPDGGKIVSGSDDNTVQLWDAANGGQLHELEAHLGGVKSVAFSPDGSKIVSGSSDATMLVWDATNGRQLKKLEGHSNPISSVAFSPDGGKIVSGSDDKTVRVWDVGSGEELKRLTGHSGGIRSVAFSLDGSKIVLGSDDKSVRVWDVGMPMKLEGHFDRIHDIGFSLDGSKAVSESDNGTGWMDTASEEQPKEPEGHFDCIHGVAFSPSGGKIVSGSDDKTVRVWDVASGRQLKKLEGGFGKISCVAFSPDSSKIVAGSNSDRTVWVWDAASWLQLKKLEGHCDWIRSVAFSPDGGKIVSGSDDKTIRVWDAASGEQLKKLEGHSEWIRSVAFSLDGRKIVSGSNDKTIRVWDTVSGEQLKKLERHLDWIRTVAFSPDGSKIMSGSDDETVRVWDVASGRELKGHSGEISNLTFSPDGRLTILESSDDSTYFFDMLNHWITHNGLKILFIPFDFRPLDSYYHSVAIHGNSLVVGSQFGRVTVFKFRPRVGNITSI